MLSQPEQAPTACAEPLTVFVCGPALSGEVLSGLTVRSGAVVWEGGTEPAPQPVEPIHAVHRIPIEGFDRLIVLVTDSGLYLTTIDSITALPPKLFAAVGDSQCLAEAERRQTQGQS